MGEGDTGEGDDGGIPLLEPTTPLPPPPTPPPPPLEEKEEEEGAPTLTVARRCRRHRVSGTPGITSGATEKVRSKSCMHPPAVTTARQDLPGRHLAAT